MINRKYIIMDRNHQEIYERGFFDSLKPNSYYQREEHSGRGYELPSYIWSSYMADAFHFPTEEDAWSFAMDTWGMDFTHRYLMIVSVHPKCAAASFEHKQIMIKKGANNG